MRITEAAPAAATPVGRPRVVTIFFAAPGVLFVALTLVLVVGPAFGFDPLWQPVSVTLPEAAARRDDAEIVRLIQHGADPNAAGTVRAGFIKSNAIILTPLEAAVGIRRADTTKLLLDHGARMDAPTWTRLICFARQEHASEVETLLLERRPSDVAANVSCDGVRTPW